MARMSAPPSSARTLISLTAALRAALVVVLLLPVTRGQNLSLEHDHLPHLHDQLDHDTNESQIFPSGGQNYNATYFKCRCDGDQAWNGAAGCVPTNTSVTVHHPDNSTVVAPTDYFAGVTVGDVQCSNGSAKVDLYPKHNPASQFTLLPDGALWWHKQRYEQYCIDHTLEDDGVSISWEASVCLPPPVVPRCCLETTNVTQGDSFSCSDEKSAQPFSPPIMLDEEAVKWPGVIAEAGRTCQHNEKELSLPLGAGKAHLTYRAGAVSIVWTTPYHLEETQSEGFCVRPQEGGFVATICYEDQEATHRNLCENVTCVRKCCNEWEIHSGNSCVAAEHDAQLWTPTFAYPDLSPRHAPRPPDYTLLYGRPQCSLFLIDPEENQDDKFYLLQNGYLFTPATDEHDPSTRYCVDNFLTIDDTISTKALVCFAEEHVEPVCAMAKKTLYPALFLVSTVFLIATLAIYLTVPDLRNKLHGRCLISLASAFLVAFALLATSYLSTSMLPPPICTTLAFFKHFSMLAAFFWLNVMCFDIWRTLRKTRTIEIGRRSLHRFLWYSVYAWGCPLLIAVVAAVLEHRLPPSHFMTPNYSNNMICWFPDMESLWVHLYVWICFVMVTNILFFVMVMVILVKGQNNSLLRRSREMHRERMWLYVKLFLVMGVTWVAEMVSSRHGQCVGWLFTDIINALEGLTLFLVFIVNRTTLRKIRTRWKCGARPSIRPSTTYTSHSSYTSKRQDSLLSTTYKSSIISRKYSNATTSSTVDPSDLESAIPLGTLTEDQDESSHSEARGQDPQDTGTQRHQPS